MKKNLIKYLGVGFSCVLLLFMKKKMVLGDGSGSNITMSLEQYYESAFISDEVFQSLDLSNLTETVNVLNNETENKTKKETKDQDTAEKDKYKNIGIANVDYYLNIRKEPKESGEIVGKLPKNAGCYIYSIDKEGWAKIASGKVNGYVKAEYLVVGDEVPEMAQKVGEHVAITTGDGVRIREKKSKDSSIITLVQKGEELVILDDSDEDWINVEIDEEKGYVARDCVEIKCQLKEAITYKESVDSTSTVRVQMVSYAKQFLGNPYVYGGTSLTNGIDCSAFMMRIYEHFGYNISRTSRSQAAEGKTISLKAIQPGDLVFYAKSGTINHVAMYIGDGQVIHASCERYGIRITQMNYRTPVKAVTFLQD